MTSHELTTLLPKLLTEAEAAVDIAKTAERNGKSLGGHNPYAERFHLATVALTSTEKKARPFFSELDLSAADQARFDTSLATVRDAGVKQATRVPAMRSLRDVCRTVLLHKVEGLAVSSTPKSEAVLPMAVVKGTRKYLETIVLQINGCYERGWYDACSVMIRKLAEILIIAVYEHKGAAEEVKQDGNFHMLSKLIEHIKGKTDWNLGRETKTALEEMKKVGDRAAHHRHYTATKQDVDKLISGLRVATQDLMAHAGIS